MVNVELSSLYNMNSPSFRVDTIEEVVDLVVHCSYSVTAFFCGGRVEFAVVIEVYSVGVKAIGPSVRGEFVGSGSCGVIGKFCKR